MRYPQTDREFQEAEEARERTRRSEEADFDNYGARQNSILHFSCGIDVDPEELLSPSPKPAPAPIDEQPCDCGHPDCTWCELLNLEEVVSKPAPVEKVPFKDNLPCPNPDYEDWWNWWDLTDADLRPDEKDGKEAA